MTKVNVEQASLDDGVPMIYKTSKDGRRVRLAYDPQRISEADALELLRLLLPRLTAGAMQVTHRADV